MVTDVPIKTVNLQFGLPHYLVLVIQFLWSYSIPDNITGSICAFAPSYSSRPSVTGIPINY